MTFNEYIEKASQYIREYLNDEFCYKDEVLDKKMDEWDIRKIPMGYTTVTDDEIEIQAYVDLVNMIFWRAVCPDGGWVHLDATLFETKERMLEFLEAFDFEDVYILDNAKIGDIWAEHEYGFTKIREGKEWEGSKE